jgi:uncharacterized repeat protein (TIGR03803 family)
MNMPRLIGIPGLILMLGAATVQAQYTNLHTFGGGTSDGAVPQSSVTLSGTNLYGLTTLGGASGKGTLFKMNTDGSGYTNLHSFAGGANDGASPAANNLTPSASGTNLYGMTTAGGAPTRGVIFSINADGTGYTNLHVFAGGPSDGNGPYSSLTLSGTNLYGVTQYGGSNSLGVIFKLNTDGSGYTNLHSFAGGSGDGEWPKGSLTLSGTNLYGMTTAGGFPLSRGVIFRINADGSGYTNLHVFAGGLNDGQLPDGSLTMNGTNLYGMTYAGGGGSGVVFKINADGSGYANLHAFAGGTNDGALPQGSLVLSGTALKGLTYNGGASGKGVLFQINLDGSGYTNLHSFAGGTSDGALPYDSLTLSGATHFGMTSGGGTNGTGVVFAVTLATVTTAANPANAGTVIGGGFYVPGTNAQLTAVASNGWLFTSWNNGTTNNPYPITVPPSNITYTANFAPASLVTGLASPTNGGRVTGSGWYIVGSNATLTAIASNNWLFINWNGGVTSTNLTIPVPATNVTYTATFAATATIVVGANTNAGGTVTGGGFFFVGSNATLTATASNGWQFLSWSDGVTNTPRTVVVASNTTFTALFAPTALITTQVSPTNTAGSVTGGGIYVVGSNALLTATASNLWRFIVWNDGATNNPYSVLVPSAGAAYTANFSRLGTVQVLASPTSGGSVTGGGQYIVGSNATVTATASNSWQFMNWNGSITNNPWVFTMTDGTTNATAYFSTVSTITVLASPTYGGSVSNGGTYLSGSNVILTATAAPNWTFASWNDSVIQNPRSLTVAPSNMTYTAIFVLTMTSTNLGAALNATSLVWQTGGSANWFTTTAASRDGHSAQSGAVGGGQQSWVQFITNGPASLVFWWKLSSEYSDTLQFSVNGQLQAQLTTAADWQQAAVYLGSTNTYTVRWTFAKNAFSVAGGNGGWLDQVTWLPCPYVTNAPQLYYQDPSGMLASWVLSSTGGHQFTRILANTGGWVLKAAGDVDGDGVSDLLFQDAANNTSGWFMNADGSTRSAINWSNTGPWELRACGDYAGEGHAQLFFQNPGGLVAFWHIDTNGVFQSSEVLVNAGVWRLCAAIPHSSTGRADLYWQTAAGLVAVWRQQPSGGIVSQVLANTGVWALCGALDVDGDGVGDLVWQTPDDSTAGWFMNSNGTARAASFWWNTGAWKLKAAGR